MPNTPSFLESTFNPEGFIFDTKVAFVPAGEYEAELLRVSDGTYKDKSTDDTIPAIRVQWLICDSSVQEEMGIPDPQAQQFIRLDLDNNGSLVMDKNRNTELSGRLLDPLGFNKGKAWSFPQLLHSRAWVRVELPRDEDASRFSNVTMVGAKKEHVARKR